MRPSGSFKGLGEWLSWLETLSPHEIDLGLDRVRNVLDRLALASGARVITVAGTNGKGSTVTMLEGLLSVAGECVGSYTSPHIHAFNERIRIDGKAVSDGDIVAAFERIEAVRQEVPLTYFEYGTLAALLVFEAAKADTIVLEVGLGGRLDAVNVVEPDACLITNVTLDHCDWLGDDVESIAAEKAGVMRAGKPVVFGSTTLPVAITTTATEKGADLIVAGHDFTIAQSGDEWTWSGRKITLYGLRKPSLEGRHQLQNAAAALALIESLGPTPVLETQTVNGVMAALDLPGRLQRIEVGEKSFVVDVAHNADSARVLREAVDSMPEFEHVTAVIGVLAGKDLDAMIAALRPVVGRWIACAADSENAVPAGELARHVSQQTGKPCLIAGRVENALEVAKSLLQETDLILVTGSFHTVGPALRWIDDLRCAQ